MSTKFQFDVDKTQQAGTAVLHILLSAAGGDVVCA